MNAQTKTHNLDDICYKIIQKQSEIIGPVAWSEAGGVGGITFFTNRDGTLLLKITSSNPKLVVDELIKRYEVLFGETSNLACREILGEAYKEFPIENNEESLASRNTELQNNITHIVPSLVDFAVVLSKLKVSVHGVTFEGAVLVDEGVLNILIQEVLKSNFTPSDVILDKKFETAKVILFSKNPLNFSLNNIPNTQILSSIFGFDFMYSRDLGLLTITVPLNKD